MADLVEPNLTMQELMWKQLVLSDDLLVERRNGSHWLLSKAREQFFADRISLEQFEYEVERALRRERDPLDEF